jgi:hypothetical protein
MSRVHDSRLGGPARLRKLGSISDITSPGVSSGCALILPTTGIRPGCEPAAMQAAFSLRGRPSLVSAPLNIFTATGSSFVRWWAR